MDNKNEYIITGPKKEYNVTYESFGRYLFDSLKKRKSWEIIAIDASTKETLTCGELLEKSVKLSTVLQKLSIQKGDVIAIISENALLYYTAVCASMFCGAQLNLLNPAYKIGEIKHAFNLSKPKLVISSKMAVQNILSIKEEHKFIRSIILLEKEGAFDIPSVEELIRNSENINGFEPAKVDITDTAILCLSSGTTGLPKCVELSHRNFIPILDFFYDRQYLELKAKDITVLILPFFHFYGLVVHLLGITISLTVIIIKSFKPDVFLQTIEEYQATTLFLVPSLLLFLTKNSIVSKFNLKSLKYIFVGAALLSDKIYEEALKQFSYCTIRQLYGSTEACGMCTVQSSTDKFCTIGKVVHNGTIKIVDADTKELLGPNEVGEICFKSTSVMKGYLNNLSETKNSFDNDGFYHTGDVGYYDNNKNFYIVGRLKELIKYKAFQVAPAEIENILLTHSDVQDCGVVGLKDEKCGELPLAFVVRQTDSKITENELVEYVAEQISVQKQLHGGVRFIEQIPRNSSGKILRGELIKLLSKV